MIEMIQGPMKTNQNQLIDTKLLETLKDFTEEYNNKFIAGETTNKIDKSKFVLGENSTSTVKLTRQTFTVGISQLDRIDIEKKVKADIIIKCIQLYNDILEGNSQDKTIFNKMDIVDTSLLMEI